MIYRKVKIDGRTFIVCMDGEGAVTNIKERVIYAEGKPWQAFMNVSRWHRDHNTIPKNPKAIYRRVIDEARRPAVTGL